MLRYYDPIILSEIKPIKIVITIDPAISKKTTADYTAMLMGYHVKENNETHLYISPYLVNKRLNITQIITEVQLLTSKNFYNCPLYIYIENVGFQTSIITLLSNQGFMNIKPYEIHGLDKMTRLSSAQPYIESGAIQFPSNEESTYRSIS